MLVYILGITKRGNKWITNRGKFLGLQTGARGVTNRGSLGDFKLGQQDYKSGQGCQIEARNFKSGQRLQIGASKSKNRGRDFKSGQRLQIGAEQLQTSKMRHN